VSTINPTTKKIIYKDDRLDIDRLDQYSLSFFIGAKSIQLTVFDEKKRRLLLYEHHDSTNQSVIDVLQEIHKEHILISAGFWQSVRVNIDSQQFSIVPSDLFSFEHQFDYIKLNSPTNPNKDAYRSVTYDPFGIAFVFVIKKDIVKWFSDKYFNTDVRHSHIGLNFLSMVYKQLDKKNDTGIFINLSQIEMQIAGISNGKLEIYNQLTIGNPEQLMKFVLLTIKQFTALGQSTKITLWAEKYRMIEYKAVFSKYFKNLKIGDRPKIKLSTQFSELKSYEIADVLSVHA
jgi:Protein of unknown function (DUF3822)